MKKTFTRLMAVLLTMAMLCSLLVPGVSAGDYWWEEYVQAPESDWSIPGVVDGAVHSTGNYIMFTSDTHRYTYLTKDLLAAGNALIAADGNEGNVGLMAFGGDFANDNVLYDDIMTILKAAVATSEGTVATYTKGNHENEVADADFAARAGMSRVGETCTNDNYYFYNFGVGSTSQEFLQADIDALSAYLAAHNDGKPVFIVSHFPLHYYNDRRSSKLAAALIDMLNGYPQVVFLWGHNHTEADPAYGTIRTAGDLIMPEAAVSSSREITFTYASLGALRDGTNGANGLLARVDEDGIVFRYINLANTTNGDTWIDAEEEENPVRVAASYENANDYVSSTTEVDPTPVLSVIDTACITIDRPLVDKAPSATAGEFSDRFDVESVTWTDAEGPVTGTFDFDTSYTATVILKAAEGYTFAENASVYGNKKYVGPMGPENPYLADATISEDGKTATIVYEFAPTTAMGETAYEMATELVDGNVYMLVATDENYAASYLYNPADHGEESKPEYKTAPADVVIRDGKLVSEIPESTLFTAQKDYSGYLMASDASLRADARGEFPEDGPRPDTTNTLNMTVRGGGEMNLEASESISTYCYNNWNIDAEGRPFVDMDGAPAYAAYTSGAFAFVSDPAQCNARFYDLGTNPETTIYNVSVNVKTPVPGEAASAEATVSGGAVVTDVEWSVESFDYAGSYTVTITAKAAEGYELAEICTGRVNGDAADTATVEAGVITVTKTFSTAPVPGPVLSLVATKVDTITSGKRYVIVSNGIAMTGSRNGAYGAGVAVTEADGQLTSEITKDMVFTLSGDDTAGYKMLNDAGYVKGYKPVADKPDTWGLDFGTSGITVSYVDGDLLKIVSTGDSGKKPKPGGAVNYLYENDGHFNYFTLQQDPFTLYELSVGFEDVAETRYYAEPIAWAAMNGVACGRSATEFAPNETCTRAEALTFLWRANGRPVVEAENPFVDVSTDAYYYDAVMWAVANNITAGVDTTHFAPDRVITRAEMITFTYRAAGEPEATPGSKFSDVSATSYYAAAVAWGVENGIVCGKTATTFAPKDPCTRAQTVTFLYRYCVEEPV